MSTLHLVFSEAGFDAARARISPGDAVLLIADGTYAAVRGTALVDAPVHALAEDLMIRGIEADDTVGLVDYAGMVELTVSHQPVVSWRE